MTSTGFGSPTGLLKFPTVTIISQPAKTTPTLPIPAPPSFADFKFRSIGRQPELLKRFSESQVNPDDEEMSTSSETDQNINHDSEQNLVPRTRPSLWEALVESPIHDDLGGQSAMNSFHLPMVQTTVSHGHVSDRTHSLSKDTSIQGDKSSWMSSMDSGTQRNIPSLVPARGRQDSDQSLTSMQLEYPSPSPAPSGVAERPMTDGERPQPLDSSVPLMGTLCDIQTRLQSRILNFNPPNLASASLLAESANNKATALLTEARRVSSFTQEALNAVQKSVTAGNAILAAAVEVKGLADGAKAELERVLSRDTLRQHDTELNEIRELLDRLIGDQEADGIAVRGSQVRKSKSGGKKVESAGASDVPQSASTSHPTGSLATSKSRQQTSGVGSGVVQRKEKTPLFLSPTPEIDVKANLQTSGVRPHPPQAKTKQPLFFSPTPEVDVKTYPHPWNQPAAVSATEGRGSNGLAERQRKQLEEQRRSSAELESRSASLPEVAQLETQQREREVEKKKQEDEKRRREEHRQKEVLARQEAERKAREEQEKRAREQELREKEEAERNAREVAEVERMVRDAAEAERKKTHEAAEEKRRAQEKVEEERKRLEAEAEKQLAAALLLQQKREQEEVARQAEEAERRAQEEQAREQRMLQEQARMRAEQDREEKLRQEQARELRALQEQAQTRAEQEREEKLRQEQEIRRQQIQAEKNRTMADRAQQIRAQREHQLRSSVDFGSEMSLESSPEIPRIPFVISPNLSTPPNASNIDPAAPTSPVVSGGDPPANPPAPIQRLPSQTYGNHNTSGNGLVSMAGPNNSTTRPGRLDYEGGQHLALLKPATTPVRNISLPPVAHLSPNGSLTASPARLPPPPPLSVHRRTGDAGNVPIANLKKAILSPQAQAANLRHVVSALQLPPLQHSTVKVEPNQDESSLLQTTKKPTIEPAASQPSSQPQQSVQRVESQAAIAPPRVSPPVPTTHPLPAKPSSGPLPHKPHELSIPAPSVATVVADIHSRSQEAQRNQTQQQATIKPMPGPNPQNHSNNHTETQNQPQPRSLPASTIVHSRSASPFRMGPDIYVPPSPIEYDSASDGRRSLPPSRSHPEPLAAPQWDHYSPSRSPPRSPPPFSHSYRPSLSRPSSPIITGRKRPRDCSPPPPKVRDYRDHNDRRPPPPRRRSRTPPPRRNRRPSLTRSLSPQSGRIPLASRLTQGPGEDYRPPSPPHVHEPSRPELLNRFMDPRASNPPISTLPPQQSSRPPPNRSGRGRGKRGRSGGRPGNNVAHAPLEQRISSGTTLMHRLEDPPRP